MDYVILSTLVYGMYDKPEIYGPISLYVILPNLLPHWVFTLSLNRN